MKNEKYSYENKKNRQKFLHGDCSAFAVALHKQTGWPLYATWCHNDIIPYRGRKTREKDREFSNTFLNHAFVKNNNGKAVDIRGIHKTGIAKIKRNKLEKREFHETVKITLKETKAWHTKQAERHAVQIIKASSQIFGITKT